MWTGLLVIDFLVLAGNTAYPVFLRGLLKLLHRCCSQKHDLHRTITFLLSNPRRVYTVAPGLTAAPVPAQGHQLAHCGCGRLHDI